MSVLIQYFKDRDIHISEIMHMDDERFNKYCTVDGDEIIDDNVCVCLSRLGEDSLLEELLGEFCDKEFGASIDEVYAIFPKGFK